MDNEDDGAWLTWHVHEPKIPPALDEEGRCLICVMLVRIATLEAEVAKWKESDRLVAAQHVRLCDRVYEEDGETLKQVALQAELVALKSQSRK